MGKKLGVFAIILLFAIFAAVLISMVSGFATQMDDFQLVFWSAAFIFIILTVILLFARAFGFRSKNTGSILISLVASVFLFSGLFLFLVCVRNIGFNTALALAMTAPLIFIIIAPIFTKEKLNTAKIFAVIIFAGGSACISYANGIIYPIAVDNLVYALGAGVCWGVFSLLALKTKTSVFVNVYIYMFIGVIAATVILFVRSSFILPVYSDIFRLLLFSAVAVAMIFIWDGVFAHSSASFWAANIFIITSVLLLFNVIFNAASLPLMAIVGLSVTGLAVIYRMAIRM